MQLDMFSAAVDLRQTKLPELGEALARVGVVEDWATLTLGEVLELWYKLYEDFVAVLNEPIEHARGLSKDTPDADRQARKFYQREYERLVQGQNRLHGAVASQYSDNLEEAFEVGKAILRQEGLSEEEAEDSGEFFNGIIQHPDSADLVKPLPTLMRDLAHEYLRLER
jgi:hypothetical protein